ncbi:hypothetical protein GGI00_004660, partial [Coemansia sp. RSA 2681]
QWVEETRLANERFCGHPHKVWWVERMAEQLLCLVSMGVCGGAVGQYREVVLRRDAAPKARRGGNGKPQYVVSRLIVSKDDIPAVTIVDMWRQIVREALHTAGISESDLEWDIASELAAGACMGAVPEQELLLLSEDDGSLCFETDLGWGAVLAISWDTEPALQPMCYHHTATTLGNSRIATQLELDDMDALFDQCSGLFHSLPPLSALSPAVCPEDLLLSWRQLEESYDDDSRYSRLADSLAGEEDDDNGKSDDNNDEWVAATTTPATSATRGRRHYRQELYNPTPPDTFMRRLEATPESVARDILRVAREESQSKRALELGPVPKVLAPATPVVARPVLRLMSAAVTPAGSRNFVPETPPIPLLRTYSLDSAIDCVPETPLHVTASRYRPPPPLPLPPVHSLLPVSSLSSSRRFWPRPLPPPPPPPPPAIAAPALSSATTVPLPPAQAIRLPEKRKRNSVRSKPLTRSSKSKARPLSL